MVDITIEVVSDIVCIWCFIGKRTLEKAISLYQKTYPGGKQDTFTITWQPYYLNYNRFVSATESVDKSEVAKVKFQDVSQEKMDAMRKRVNQITRANGIDFKSGGKIGSTQDAHRLIHLSQCSTSFEVQDAVVEKLFQSFHEKEEDITDHNVLANIAAESGMSRAEVIDYLASDQDKTLMDQEAEENRKRVTAGVPTFFIQGKYRVDGAQDLQEFFDSFVKIRELGKE